LDSVIKAANFCIGAVSLPGGKELEYVCTAIRRQSWKRVQVWLFDAWSKRTVWQ